MPPDQLAFDIVDVFAETPYAGNQLAVVHGADGLSDAQRLAVAREFGFSETTFPSPQGPAAILVFGSALVVALIGASALPIMQDGHASSVTLGPWWILPIALALGQPTGTLGTRRQPNAYCIRRLPLLVEAVA